MRLKKIVCMIMLCVLLTTQTEVFFNNGIVAYAAEEGWKDILIDGIEHYDEYGLIEELMWLPEYNQIVGIYEISLSNFVDNQNQDEIDEFLRELQYRTPEYYYLAYLKYDVETNKLSVAVKYQYVNADGSINRLQAIKDYFLFEERVSSLTMQLDEDMSDLEKLLAIHEWVARESEYDYANYLYGIIPDISYTAEGVFDNNLAVCDGYTRAMSRLLNREGIENVRVESEIMNHAWNAVKIDDKYYHVDTTWDDVGKDDYLEGFVNHMYFLKSDKEFKALEHYKWTGPECVSDDSYEEYIFRNDDIYYTYKTYDYYQDFWYYQVDDTILKSKIDGTQQSEFMEFDETIINKYIYKGYMYVATYTKVYKINLLNIAEREVVFDTKNTTDMGTYISEFSIKNDVIKIDGSDDLNSVSLVLDNSSSIELKQEEIILKEDETARLDVVAVSEYSSDVQWASSNPKVVSVDDAGNVVANNAGTSVIVASVDGVMAECVVTVEKEYMLGDLNNDGNIDTSDAVLIKKYLAGYDDLEIVLEAADLNSDGEINSTDVVILLKYLAGYDIEELIS